MEETITGMQSVGVQACSKHYIGNEQETQRNPSSTSFTGGAAAGPVIEAVSANIDDRKINPSLQRYAQTNIITRNHP
jgi:beta-glucosidase